MIDTRQNTKSGSIGILPAGVFEEAFGRLRRKGLSASELRNAGEWIGRRSIALSMHLASVAPPP